MLVDVQAEKHTFFQTKLWGYTFFFQIIFMEFFLQQTDMNFSD